MSAASIINTCVWLLDEKRINGNDTKKCITVSEKLPGGDFGPGGIKRYYDSLKARFPWVSQPQLDRYVRYYGTRTDGLLDGAKSLIDLGSHFGAGFYQREIDFLIRNEWAETIDDVIWRRTKIGLHLSSTQIEQLDNYLASR